MKHPAPPAMSQAVREYMRGGIAVYKGDLYEYIMRSERELSARRSGFDTVIDHEAEREADAEKFYRDVLGCKN